MALEDKNDDNINKRYREYLTTIDKSTSRLQTLIEKILNVA